MKTLLTAVLLTALISTAAWGQAVPQSVNPTVVAVQLGRDARDCPPTRATVGSCQYRIVALVGRYTGDADYLVVLIVTDGRTARTELLSPSGGIAVFTFDAPPNVRSIQVAPVKASGETTIAEIMNMP